MNRITITSPKFSEDLRRITIKEQITLGIGNVSYYVKHQYVCIGGHVCIHRILCPMLISVSFCDSVNLKRGSGHWWTMGREAFLPIYNVTTFFPQRK